MQIFFSMFFALLKTFQRSPLVTWYRVILPITSDAGSFRGGTSGSRRAEWMPLGFGEMSFRSERWNLSLRKDRHHTHTRREMRRSNLLADLDPRLDKFLLRYRGCLFQTSLALVYFSKSLKSQMLEYFLSRCSADEGSGSDPERWSGHSLVDACARLPTRVFAAARALRWLHCMWPRVTAAREEKKGLQDLRTSRPAASLCSNLGHFQTEPQKQTAGYFLCLQSHFSGELMLFNWN